MKIKFVPNDLWIGLYWHSECVNASTYGGLITERWEKKYYLCIIPCFPIMWTTYWLENSI